MTSFKRLSDTDKAMIKSHESHDMTGTEIAAIIGRHHTTVSRYLRSPFMATRLKKVGLSAKLLERLKQNIIEWAYIRRKSASTIIKNLKLDVEIRRMLQVLQNDTYLEYIKRVKSPFLTEDHKKKWGSLGKGLTLLAGYRLEILHI